MDKLKFSQLLLIGAKQVKHIREQYTDSRNGKVLSACAIGMIAVARAGSLDQVNCRAEVKKLKRELIKIMVPKPYPESTKVMAIPLSQFIVNMNDHDELSPEKMAKELKERGF